MTEICYYVAQSLDGFIATPEGGLDWLKPFEESSEDYGYAPFYSGIEAVLMGRSTFEVCRTMGDWPYAGKSTWVFSRRSLGALPPNVLATGASPLEVVAQLRASRVRRAWLVGGGELAGAFLAAGLIDRLIVSVMPVALGRGIPIFGDRTAGAWPLLMERFERYPDGVVQLGYRAIR